MENMVIKIICGMVIAYMVLPNFVSSGGNAARNNEVSKDDLKANLIDEVKILRRLIEKVKNRISLGKDVAIYKWINGKPILDKIREIAVMENVENMAKEMKLPFGEDERQFVSDLMEATKLIQYTLVSDWSFTQTGNIPKDSTNLGGTRNKINAIQADIIRANSDLKRLRHSKHCEETVSKYISDCSSKVNPLLRIALIRAFGNFCKTHNNHKVS